jgi:hypothetical protein
MASSYTEKDSTRIPAGNIPAYYSSRHISKTGHYTVFHISKYTHYKH